jgi:DNA-3-methyladenine glycosylase II
MILPLPKPLSLKSTRVGVSYLSRIDPVLEKIVVHLGVPPLWSREPGFPSLIHIILEQQVSLASAKAAL